MIEDSTENALQVNILCFLGISGNEFFGWVCKLAADSLNKIGYSSDAIDLAHEATFNLWKLGYIIVGPISQHVDGRTFVVSLVHEKEVRTLLQNICDRLKRGDMDAQFDLWLEQTTLGQELAQRKSRC